MREEIEDITPVDLDEKEEIAKELSENKSSKKEKNEKLTGKEILHEIMIDSIYILVVLGITLLIIKYVGQRTVVIGSSMETTLSDQDSLIVDKISYRFSDPERYDIIVFPFEYEKDTHYIKRIIGLPGERVRIDEDGNIYINDEILNEVYGTEVINDPGDAYYEITIGEDEYFVLGDNRNHSSDSRNPAVGLIKRDKIVGRAIVRIFPFNKMEVLD